MFRKVFSDEHGGSDQALFLPGSRVSRGPKLDEITIGGMLNGNYFNWLHHLPYVV